MSYEVKFTDIENQTIAFAGICQAASLIHHLAVSGKYSAENFFTSIYTTLQLQPNNIIEVFANLKHLDLGLKELIRLLSKQHPKDEDISRYIFSLIYLESQLKNNPDLLAIIQQRLTQVQQKLNHFSIVNENIIANLAGLYTDTLSTLFFRINIYGDVSILNSSLNMNKIRALLLAGVRSAALWRNYSGKKWHLVFKRKSIIKTAYTILNNLKTYPAIINLNFNNTD